jgi:hypothetical protein
MTTHPGNLDQLTWPLDLVTVNPARALAIEGYGLQEGCPTVRLVTMPLVGSFVMWVLRHRLYDEGQQFLKRLEAHCLVGD